MPRIHQKTEDYARTDLLREIRKCQGAADLMNGRLLSEASCLPYQTLMRRLKSPEDFTLGEMRLIIKALHISPLAVLKFLGYTTKEIQQIKGDSQ